jgi:glutaredoxin/glutathione-dependent peroxiredoxin
MMTIKVGDRIPEATFRVMTSDGPQARTTDDIFKGRRVVLFGVPGAFTPTCDRNHLPGFINKADEILGKGIDEICVTGVNDVFVMDAWAKHSGGHGKITFLADGSAQFAKAIGLSLDMGDRGLGTRSQRYSMLVDDGIVRKLSVEETPGKAELSGADALLKAL